MKKHVKTLLLVLIIIVAILATYFINSTIKDYRNNKEIAESITGKILPNNYKPVLAKEFYNNTSNVFRVAMLLAPEEHTILLAEGPLLNTEEDRKDFINSLANSFISFKQNKIIRFGSIENKKTVPLNNTEAIRYDLSLNSNNKKLFGEIYFINYTKKTFIIIILSKNTYYKNEIFKEFIENVSLP